MKLCELVLSIGKRISNTYSEMEITEVCENSRASHPNAIFVAIKGNKIDGNRFINDAINHGVRVVVSENRKLKMDNILVINVKNARKTLAVLSARLYGNPEKEMKFIGITGTKGKSTTAFLINKMLRKLSIESVFIGSFGIVRETVKPTSNTTPTASVIFKELRDALDSGIKLAVIEVSSQALKDFRVYGIPFSLTVFTSLGTDHVGEYEHKSRADYISAKRSLFSSYGTKIAVVNGDDPYSSFISSGAPRVLKCGFYHHNDIVIENFREEEKGASFKLLDTEVSTALHGEFNAVNATLALLVVSMIASRSLLEIANALCDIPVLGRFEEHRVKGINVVIDYAHTPESFSAVAKLSRKLYNAKIIAVFGSVSDRAYMRRNLLANAAERLFDFSIITGDDVSGEEARDVCEEIYSHFRDKSRAIIICDRDAAIRHALALANVGDVVLLLGKGQETTIKSHGHNVSFDERQIIYNKTASE